MNLGGAGGRGGGGRGVRGGGMWGVRDTFSLSQGYNLNNLDKNLQDKKFFLSVYLYEYYVKQVSPGLGHFGPQGYNLNNLGRGPLNEITYQISKLWAFYFQTRIFLSFAYRSLCKKINFHKKTSRSTQVIIFQTLVGPRLQCCLLSPKVISLLVYKGRF